MSGDVQPRKRKDKKKRRDDDDHWTTSEEIHVDHDAHTGGSICGKLIFFLLFGLLAVFIALALKNHELNEIEIRQEEYKSSNILSAWLGEEVVDDHDVHSEEPHEHEDEEDVHSEEAESQEVDEEEDHDEEEEEEYGTDEVTESEQDEDDVTKSDESEEKDLEETEEDEDDKQDEDSTEQEQEESAEQVTAMDVSKEMGGGEEEETATEEEVVEEPQDLEADDESTVTDQEATPDIEETSPALKATKIGIGLVLLAVAYNLFLRKRRFASSTPKDEHEPTPDLSRRNTLVAPPPLQLVEPDLPDVEPEYDEEYSDEEYSEEEEKIPSARDQYQELRTTYSRSLSPDADLIKDVEGEENDEELEEEEEEEAVEDEEDYERYDEDEDEELLKRLEAKYGKLGRDVDVTDEPDTESDGEGEDQAAKEADKAIKNDIDKAEQQIEKNAAYANQLFEALLDKFPLSPRCLYGKARALDIMADQKKSNDLLNQALHHYLKAMSVPDVDDQLFVSVGERYIDRARFMGKYQNAVNVHKQLIDRFPENVTHMNNLAVTYLTVNMVEQARKTLLAVLRKWPEDGFALVHYGFILKTADNNLSASVDYMRRGLKTNAPGVVDGRFYFHLGDALARLGRSDEAMKLYEEGVTKKVFLSKYQRSLYNVDHLTSKPWWDPKDIPEYEPLFTSLKQNYQKIRQEGLSALNEKGFFQDEAENLRDTGTWKQLELFSRGRRFPNNCDKTPITCGIVRRFSDASACRRGQTKFSVMHPGTHVWPHCGPTNCRLRIHLGLKVPPKTFIRVAEDTRSWKEGEIIIFDDSFEHEVWHNGSQFRLVLIVDVWHPHLSAMEKKTLSSI